MVRGIAIFALTILFFIVAIFFATGKPPLAADVSNNPIISESFQPIDLSATDWFIKRNFHPRNILGFHKQEVGVIAINRFPIDPLELFSIPPGREVHHFALMTQFDLSAETTPPLSLTIHRIGVNWAVYLNGHQLRNEIHLNLNGSIRYRRSVFGPIISIPSRFLRSGQNTLVLHLAGVARVTSLPFSHHLRLGSKNFKIDDTENIYKRTWDRILVSMNLVFIFFSLFYMVFYLLRRNDPHPLYFSLFTAFYALYQATSIPILGDFLQDMTWLYRVRWASLALLGPLMALFIHSFFFRHEKIPIPFRLIILFGAALLGWFLLAPFPWALAGVSIWQLQIVFVTITLAGYPTLAWARNLPFARAMSISLILFGIFVIIDVISTHFFFYELRFSQVAFLGLVTTIAMLIVFRFMELQREAENFKKVVEEQRDAFVRFVPGPFLDLLGRQSATEIQLGDSSLRPMSVLFSDIRNFTSLSESMNPQENFDFLNSYLKRVGPIIENNGGFVDKFLGDGLMALFAENDDRHKPADQRITSADRAVGVAIKMQREMVAYNEHRDRSGYSQIQIGIGINSGDVILGTVGSDSRLDTTVVGDTVNVASRLEELAAEFKSGIIISEITCRQLTHRNAHWIRKVGWVVLRGKSNAVNVYEVFDFEDEQTREKKAETKNLLESALDLYRNNSNKEAKKIMKQALKKVPSDPVLLKYCNQWENP